MSLRNTGARGLQEADGEWLDREQRSHEVDHRLLWHHESRLAGRKEPAELLGLPKQ